MNWINKLIGMVGAIPVSAVKGAVESGKALVSSDDTKVHTLYAVLVLGLLVLIGLALVDTFTTEYKVNTTIYSILATGVIVPGLGIVAEKMKATP